MVTRDVLKAFQIEKKVKTLLVPINPKMHSRSCNFLHIFYENIEAEICEIFKNILRIYPRLRF